MAQSVSDSEFELMKIIWESGGSAFLCADSRKTGGRGKYLE